MKLSKIIIYFLVLTYVQCMSTREYKVYAQLDFIIKPLNGINSDFESLVNEDFEESVNFYRLTSHNEDEVNVKELVFKNKKLKKITSCSNFENIAENYPRINYSFRNYRNEIDKLTNIEIYLRKVKFGSIQAEVSQCFVLIGEVTK